MQGVCTEDGGLRCYLQYDNSNNSVHSGKCCCCDHGCTVLDHHTVALSIQCQDLLKSGCTVDAKYPAQTIAP